MVTVRVNINVEDKETFKQNLKLLPKILAGKHPKAPRLRNLFWAVFMREMFRRINHSFRVRSRGEVDDTGASWHRLKAKTIRRKSRPHFRGGRYPGVKVEAAPHPSFINRDTEELLKSLAMGAISGNTYHPRNGQIAEQRGTQVRLGTDVEHAEDVDKLRDIFPDGLNKWVRESIVIAFERIAPYLGDLG